MSKLLKKEDVLFERDEEGKLVPQEVELVVDENDELQLEYKGSKVFVTPLPRGELKRVFSGARKIEEGEDTDVDVDGELIVKHCHNPKFSADEVKFIKTPLVTALVNTILSHSGLDVGGSKSRKQAAIKAEDDFAKN